MFNDLGVPIVLLGIMMFIGFVGWMALTSGGDRNEPPKLH